MVEIGARVVVESEKVGMKPKSGVVMGVNGPLVQVRWDDGRETSFVPAAGSMRVAPPTRRRAARRTR